MVAVCPRWRALCPVKAAGISITEPEQSRSVSGDPSRGAMTAATVGNSTEVNCCFVLPSPDKDLCSRKPSK